MTTPVLERIAQGDKAAVAECLDRFGGLVWSYANRYCRERAEAEDAVQEIFIELWSSARRYDRNVASETTFIAMICRRRLIDKLRKRQREPETEELQVDTVVETPQIQRTLETMDEAARATDVLESLRPEQQQVIRMSVYDGYSHSVIAEQLGMPIGTVKTHLRRGFLRLRGALGKSGDGGRRLTP